MSHLLKKSKSNFKVAEVTASDAELCCASVHCSYYAYFQFAKHILSYELNPPKPLPKDEAHKFAFLWIHDALGQLDPTQAHVFNSIWVPLHTCRLESDYDNIEISRTKAESALSHAKRIITILSSTFAITW